MLQVSKNFNLDEFVDPRFIQARGNKAIQLIDHRMITMAQFCRDWFDVPTFINGFCFGHQYTESGMRVSGTGTGATYSQHKYGRADDLKFIGIAPEEVREVIRKNWKEFRECGITTIESNTPTWVHVDCRWTGLDTLLEVPYQ